MKEGPAVHPSPARPPSGSLSDWWFVTWSRVLRARWFRRLSTALPITAWIARRRARRLFDVCAGFVYSQVLLSAVRLRLFEHLEAGPRSARELSEVLGLSVAATGRLLDAAAALELVVRRREGVYGLGRLGAAFLGTPGLDRMVEHHALLYDDLRDPVELLRHEQPESRLASYWAYASTNDGRELPETATSEYTSLMTASQALAIDEILDALPLRRCRRLLDVAGGEGRFACAVAVRHPHVEVTIVDLPSVAARARKRVEAAGLDARVSVVGIDALNEPLPTGFDVVTLVRVLLDHDDDVARRLLRTVRSAMNARGRLVIAEPMAGTPPERSTDAYMGFYLRAMGSGRPRTPSHLKDMLAEAGFEGFRLHRGRLPIVTRILSCRASA